MLLPRFANRWQWLCRSPIEVESRVQNRSENPQEGGKFGSSDKILAAAPPERIAGEMRQPKSDLPVFPSSCSISGDHRARIAKRARNHVATGLSRGDAASGG